ncbi:MAG TPA: MXAN_5187 C-terminal domain-containing protein [Terriglobales bacterium]|nr:MXAN_5187 C-terminal domain-containing protein [Terriglobales bacterium]
MTVDEEIGQLDDALRRLKIEYDIFFGGGSKRPPTDLEWRVQSLLKKFSDSQRLSVAQRFRFNAIQQKYAVFSDLWRQKAKIKEEGYRRSQDAVLGIQGLRTEQEHAAGNELKHKVATLDKPFRVAVSDPAKEQEHLKSLYSALSNAKKNASDAGEATNYDAFRDFVMKKTQQIRKQYSCDAVEYQVELKQGRVKLVARPKK